MAAEAALSPGSPSLGNQLNMSVHYRTLKGLQTHSDGQFQTHLVLIEEKTRNAMALAHPQLKIIRDNLIQLQALLLEGEKGHISDHLVALALQVYLKTSADLIYLTGNKENIPVVPLLCSLSYQSVACVTFDDSQLSAWSARMALDSLTLFHFIFNSDAASIWESSEFGDLVVDALSQDDNDGLKLLHSRIYDEAKDSADYLQPEMTVDLASHLAKRIRPLLGTESVLQTLLLVIRRERHGFNQFAFFSSLFSTLPRAPNPSSDCELGMEDVAVFLVTLSTVSRLSDSTPIIGRVKITAEQLKHWKAMCQIIASPCNCAAKEKILVNAAVNCVRLKSSGVSNLRTIYPVFQWLVDRGFPDDWMHLYAEHIREEIIGMPTVKPSSLFSVTNNFYYNPEEEEKILDAVNICLAEIAVGKGRYHEADELLAEVRVKPSSKKNLISYKLYASWIGKASSEEEKAEITKKLVKIQALLPQSELSAFPVVVSPQKEPVKLPPVAKEQISLSSVISVTSPMRRNGGEEVSVGTSPRPLTPSSPFGDLSFTSARSSTRDYGTSTDNSFLSAVESPYRSGDGDRTPTELSPAKTSPHSNEVSPPEEPFHREYVDEGLDPISPSFRMDDQVDELEDSYLFEYIVCKMKKTTLAMEETNNAKGDFVQAVADSQVSDMQQKMDDMKIKYEEKLRTMEKELEEAKKKEKKDQRPKVPATAPNLAEPHQILKSRMDTMIREQIAIQNTTYSPPTVVASVHPGHTGFCLGCASDADQDKVMRVLDALSKKWDESD